MQTGSMLGRTQGSHALLVSQLGCGVPSSLLCSLLLGCSCLLASPHGGLFQLTLLHLHPIQAFRVGDSRMIADGEEGVAGVAHTWRRMQAGQLSHDTCRG